MSLTGTPDPILINLARVIRDLLEHPENLILFGRLNAEQEQQNINYIVIDSIGPEVPLSKSESFNGDDEVMTYSSHISKPVTVDFFGQPEQTIGLARHGRWDYNDLMAGVMPFGDATRDVLDALGRAHRRAAIFMND